MAGKVKLYRLIGPDGNEYLSPEKGQFGTHLYNDSGAMMFSVDTFEIHIQGKGGHGASPHLSVDPINIGVHIYLALQELIAERIPSAFMYLSAGYADK